MNNFKYTTANSKLGSCTNYFSYPSAQCYIWIYQ